MAYTGALPEMERSCMSALDIIELDATGLQCPMPLLKAKRALNAMEAGQCLRVLATDRGSVRDFRVFA
jgi:tRNA 2-thiouridine synthesizing protein A